MNNTIFLILNLVLAISFILLTLFTDKKLRNDFKDSTALIVPLLLVSVESVLLLIALFFKDLWYESFINAALKLIFCIDGVFFVTFSFGLVSLAGNTKKVSVRLIQIACIILALYLVIFRFDKVFFNDNEYNLVVASESLFDGDMAKFFPFTWVDLYDFLFKGFLPIACYIFLVLLQEKNGNTLQRYQGLLIGFSFVILWALSFFVKTYMASVNSSFTCLFIYPYLFMMIISISALQKTSVPSGRILFAVLLQIFITFILPAGVIGFLVMYMQPVISNTYALIGLFGVFAIVAVVFSLKINQILSNSKTIYSADYAEKFEKELGSMNYNGEMDEITNRMNSIFRNNVESSSMNVYVLNNKGKLETAYSSNNFHKEISVSNPIFDELLNVEKSVVVWSEIGHVHIISNIDNELKAFFEETNSDALFVLNEGRNILGLITLGKKISGDHYKEYDVNVFNKLYSYFFVFGYYMRNISNKEIISVVNREIRMSSQIITSIQENIDPIKNPKVDTGYLMVPAHNLGGEFIDMIRLTDTRHLFIVGDLSGKGIAASMNMVILKSIIRTYLAETHDFKELVVKINSFIRTSFRKGTIFAGLFALIDFETDTMYYINCGIPTLMLYTQVYNNVIEIQGSGHILGFVKDIGPYISVKSTKLNPGDVILACTDGLVTSHSLRGEQFGKERIQQCILDNSTYAAQRMTQFTFDTLTKFMSKEMEDDVSILVLKYDSNVKKPEDDSESEETEVNDEIKVESQEEQVADSEEVVENNEIEKSGTEVVSEVVTQEAQNNQPETENEKLGTEDYSVGAVSDEVVTPETAAEVAKEENNFMPEGMDDIPGFSKDDIAAAIAQAQAEAGINPEDMFTNPNPMGQN